MPEEIEPTLLNKSVDSFKKELILRIKEGEEILKEIQNPFFNFTDNQSKYNSWNVYNIELLKQSFNKPRNEYRKSYEHAGEHGTSTVSVFGRSTTPAQAQQRFLSKFKTKIYNLKNLHQRGDLLKSSISEPSENVKRNLEQVFIVHGHDELARVETARFVEQLGLEPIILHEQASSGKTIIEKIEEYSNVGFGIVLYTPCDVGGKKGDEKNHKSRARQNVVFEHGYLIGRIGRKNVCALVKGEVETPNDISGIVYISLRGDWRLSLAKELKSSGYTIDMNLVV